MISGSLLGERDPKGSPIGPKRAPEGPQRLGGAAATGAGAVMGHAMCRAGAAVVVHSNRLAPRQGGARRISRRLAPPLPAWGSARALPSAAADARVPTVVRVLLKVSSVSCAVAGGRRQMRLTPARADVAARVRERVREGCEGEGEGEGRVFHVL